MNNKSELRYPRLHRRIRAAFIDIIILGTMFFISASVVLDMAIHGVMKVVIVGTVLFILEPGLVTTMGGTIGHQLLGLRIQNRETGTNLNILFAAIRFIIKSILGLPSFIFVLVTKRHQAIHDIVSSSVVVIKNPTGIDEYGEQKERDIYQVKFEYPAWYQRVIVIVIYNLIALIILVAITLLLISEECTTLDRCTSSEIVIQSTTGLVWLVAAFALLVSGWTGRLFGARRKPHSPAATQSKE
jgi:uncharacterized RDD family membrane protein YckC